MFHVCHVVLGEVTRIGSGVGDHLVTLIKRLGKTEGVFGGEGGFPLKGRKIVKLRSDLLGRLFLLGDGASFALAAFCDEHCLFLVPDPFGTTVGMSGVFFEV